MRFFNTAGPCDPRFHFMLPAAERLPQAPGIVERGGCFAVHAHGILVIFDRRSSAPPMTERIAIEQKRSPAGYQVTVLRA